MKFKVYFSLIVLLFFSCQKIEKGKNLSKDTIEHIYKMGLLEKGEKIILFYSNYQKDKAGNFFTNKRIAHYWIDDNHPEKNDTTFAFYNDIISIDTTYTVPDFDAPYMTITKSDNSQFKVYADGDKKEMRSFFEQAILEWNINKGK